jgi:hypothetical protein
MSSTEVTSFSEDDPHCKYKQTTKFMKYIFTQKHLPMKSNCAVFSQTDALVVFAHILLAGADLRHRRHHGIGCRGNSEL